MSLDEQEAKSEGGMMAARVYNYHLSALREGFYKVGDNEAQRNMKVIKPEINTLDHHFVTNSDEGKSKLEIQTKKTLHSIVKLLASGNNLTFNNARIKINSCLKKIESDIDIFKPFSRELKDEGFDISIVKENLSKVYKEYKRLYRLIDYFCNSNVQKHKILSKFKDSSLIGTPNNVFNEPESNRSDYEVAIKELSDENLKLIDDHPPQMEKVKQHMGYVILSLVEVFKFIRTLKDSIVSELKVQSNYDKQLFNQLKVLSVKLDETNRNIEELRTNFEKLGNRLITGLGEIKESITGLKTEMTEKFDVLISKLSNCRKKFDKKTGKLEEKFDSKIEKNFYEKLDSFKSELGEEINASGDRIIKYLKLRFDERKEEIKNTIKSEFRNPQEPFEGQQEEEYLPNREEEKQDISKGSYSSLSRNHPSFRDEIKKRHYAGEERRHKYKKPPHEILIRKLDHPKKKRIGFLENIGQKHRKRELGSRYPIHFD